MSCTHTIMLVCVQVNGAFAAQFLSVEKELGLDRERTNVNGGAIALGHAPGCLCVQDHYSPCP